jgi:hypothetical protein
MMCIYLIICVHYQPYVRRGIRIPDLDRSWKIKIFGFCLLEGKLFLRESSWTLLTIIYTKMEVCELNQWRPIQSENLIEKCWYITNNLVHFLLSQISSSDHQNVTGLWKNILHNCELLYWRNCHFHWLF